MDHSPFSMSHIPFHGCAQANVTAMANGFCRTPPRYPGGTLQSAYQGFEERMDRRALSR